MVPTVNPTAILVTLPAQLAATDLAQLLKSER